MTPSFDRPVRLALLVLSLALSACAADTGATVMEDDGGSLSVLTTEWRDQRGRTLRLADLGERIHLVAMVYTSCTLTCPLTVGELQRIEASVPVAQRAQLSVVLVSLDPDRDTSDRLAEYAAANRFDPARWTLLSGSDAAVRELAAVLEVRYQAQPDGEIAHTNGITVLDRSLRVAHTQPTLGGGVEETMAVVRSLLR